MTSEKHGVNFIDRITISIDMLYFNNDKIMDDSSSLFKNKLKHIINENITNLASSINRKLYFKRIILDLGDIEINLFERETTRKFEIELKKHLNKHYSYYKYTSRTEKTSPQKTVQEREEYNIHIKNRDFNGVSLIENVDNYLRKGNLLSDDSKHHVTNIVRIDNELWQQINHQPQQWLPMLAKHCLQPASLSRLIQICQPDVPGMLYQLFTETTSEFFNSQAQEAINTKVTPEKLSLSAEHYLRHQIKYINATQPERIILQNQDNFKSVNNTTVNSNNSLTSDALENNILLNIVQPFSQQTTQPYHQITAEPLSNNLIKDAKEKNLLTLQHKTDNTISPQLLQSVLPISNAGCMILWPLLPTFYRTFDLLERNQFISLEAQREAVCLLDWLIWGEEEIPAWRLTLNKVICGLPINDNALWRTPKPEQQIAINQWLEKIIVQLPAWKKMGVNDVRHLFLQRSGELSGSEEVMEIHIKSEIYDALIAEWPWPINMASFSWLKQPITMTWL
ncbi:contractile injection system tape measure protein [Xenorhabdus bovienii]|uniref:contractile injection system tape measure protein n=1 Tax=Xenorhabdus bovienii TaxID=40576 RepID=UPI002157D404|nr:contractile injection system tape measure protein [Xenorhabdus bovienii]